MSCKDTIHLICWYLEGRLSTSVEGEIKRHLEKCSDCHLVLDAAIASGDPFGEKGAPFPCTGPKAKRRNEVYERISRFPQHAHERHTPVGRPGSGTVEWHFPS